jgi:glycosyltransferase involved in cell wall biosynthesis
MTTFLPRPARTLGLLPPLGGSLTSLQLTGQVARLVDYYLPAYLEHFDRIHFFSSRHESLEQFTSDPSLLRRMRIVLPATPHDGRMAGLTRLFRRGELQQCSVLRALQAPGALPALTSTVPLVVTYGYSYLEVSRFAGRHRWSEAVRQVALTGVLKAVLRKAKVTLLTNPELEGEARQFGARRLEMISNGVPLELFAPASTESETPYDIVLLGRLSNEKNLGVVARAAAILGRPLRVCVVGDGPLRASLEAELRESGCRATFLGTRPYAELPGILRSAAIYVLPSSTEGRSKALLEAMACGLPCVVSDIPALAPMVHAGAALAFPAHDAGALARLVEGLLSDPAERERQGRAGREFVVHSASLERSLLEETRLIADVARIGEHR